MRLLSALMAVFCITLATTADADTLDAFSGSSLNSSAYTAFASSGQAPAISQSDGLTFSPNGNSIDTYVTNATYALGTSMQVHVTYSATVNDPAAFLVGFQQNMANVFQGGTEYFLDRGDSTYSAILWNLNNMNGSGNSTNPPFIPLSGVTYTVGVNWGSSGISGTIKDQQGNLLTSYTWNLAPFSQPMHVVLGSDQSATFTDLSITGNAVGTIPLPSTASAGLGLLGGLGVLMLARRRKAAAVA